MATRGGRTRRGRNDVWRSLYGVDNRGNRLQPKTFSQVQQTPLALAAGVYGKIELVTQDLSRLDVICPRAMGRFPLVPEPERTPVFR